MDEIKKIFRPLKRFFCKHENIIWLRPMNEIEVKIIYPCRVCINCGKLTWVEVTFNKHTYLKPEKISVGKS